MIKVYITLHIYQKKNPHMKKKKVYIIYNKALWRKPAHASLDGSAARGGPVKRFQECYTANSPTEQAIQAKS